MTTATMIATRNSQYLFSWTTMANMATIQVVAPSNFTVVKFDTKHADFDSAFLNQTLIAAAELEHSENISSFDTIEELFNALDRNE